MMKFVKESRKRKKKIINFETLEDRQYKKRFPKERFNALFKDFHGGGAEAIAYNIQTRVGIMDISITCW